MSLSEQETRCVELACRYLSQVYGGSWAAEEGPPLEEQHRHMPVPEVRVTNGDMSAAIEVKRLAGPSEWQTYRQSLYSLEKKLTPSCGGYYVLTPWIGFHLPLSPKSMKYVKKQIEGVAPSISVGDKAAIRIPRKAPISMVRADGPGFIYCAHDYSGESFRECSHLVTGAFWLVDVNLPEHQFLSPAARDEFHQKVVAACRARVETGSGVVEWFEEWGLHQVEADEDGVLLIAAIEGVNVADAARECVWAMVEKSIDKFSEPRWADLHVLVLDKADWTARSDLVRSAIMELDEEDLRVFDHILFVDSDSLEEMWSKRAPAGRGSDTDTDLHGGTTA